MAAVTATVDTAATSVWSLPSSCNTRYRAVCATWRWPSRSRSRGLDLIFERLAPNVLLQVGHGGGNDLRQRILCQERLRRADDAQTCERLCNSVEPVGHETAARAANDFAVEGAVAVAVTCCAGGARAFSWAVTCCAGVTWWPVSATLGAPRSFCKSGSRSVSAEWSSKK